MKGGLKLSASAILLEGQILDEFWTLWINEFLKGEVHEDINGAKNPCLLYLLSQQYPNNVQSQQFQQFQTASISANNAKEVGKRMKYKYEIWAMKMEYWIQNADHNLWRIVQQGNSPKRLGKDAKGNTIVHPPVSLDEHVAVQRENKVRTLLLQALPEDHMPDFHHYDDARDIWMAVKASAFLLRWSQVALALKTRGGLESMSFDDLYNKLRSLELDVRIGHSYGVKAAAAPTHSAFIGAASSGSKLT
ncbi:hypothetical protein Tco_0705727 [Tanacetum coccineum]|uniref:Uncharacterized protein n=1 Tax=Tanacetum coccineum TaxID=301880 RepID=A0ABQ4Y6Y7_9ASTR